MEHTDPYIKLSKVRDDYGVDGRQGTDFYMSELDGLAPAQLTALRKALVDEVDDIGFQIDFERKHLEKGSRWMYGAKHSIDARNAFIQRIDELLREHPTDEQVALRFMALAKQALDSGVYASILATAKGETSGVFSAEDIG